MRNINDESDDQQLSEVPFIWQKKFQRQGLSNASPEYIKTIREKTIKKNEVSLFL
jgi:hypothetical protein